jgi:glycosyltransferase involved in cell wall biosynthesis
VFRRKWGERAIDMWERKTIPAFEQRVLDQVDCGLLCSTVDARFFRTLHPRGRIEVIENAVDPNQFAVQTHTSGHRPRCIITGTLFYFPNIDSIRYYAEAILPALRRTFPEMETLLIGTRPTAEIQQLDGKNGIRVLANVPSMQDHLFMDDIYVCPLRVAAGVRNKLLEAMAAEMPIVSTRLGAEGMAVHEGRELLFAEDQEAFIQQIRRLIEDRSFARDLGKRGRAYIETHHSLEVIGAKLEQLYTELQSSSSTF